MGSKEKCEKQGKTWVKFEEAQGLWEGPFRLEIPKSEGRRRFSALIKIRFTLLESIYHNTEI